MTTALLEQAPSFYYRDQTSGWSAVSDYVAKQSTKIVEHLRKSNSLGAGIDTAIEELRDIANECALLGWDGYNATPIENITLNQAMRFLNALPLGMNVPLVGAEPDGQITFEWSLSPRRILSVSISKEGEVHYAALIGTSKHYGSERFFGEISPDILNLARRAITQ